MGYGLASRRLEFWVLSSEFAAAKQRGYGLRGRGQTIRGHHSPDGADNRTMVSP
jgi:hypothetical protein